MDHSGLFTLREFEGREVLKLAPDAYIELNGASSTRVISPVGSGDRSLDMRGGITSISTQASVTPAGSSNCSIEISAPQYKGLHEDYYITLPSGVKVPMFIPMMEVKVFMKGRFFNNGAPIYYQVFWGFIKDVTESYSGGVSTFHLNCGDMLSWWRYQTVATIPGAFSSSTFGGPRIEAAPSLFKNMNPFEIILKLFTETAFNEFATPRPSGSNIPPVIEGYQEQAAKFGPLFRKTIDYWANKYFSSNNSTSGQNNRDSDGNIIDINQEGIHLNNYLEVYGFRGRKPLIPLLESMKARRISGNVAKRMNSTDDIDKIELDFSVLEFIIPFNDFSKFQVTTSGASMTKIDIANVVTEVANFEFFLDTNGKFVLKPPFYNLDTKHVEVYRVQAKDITSFSAHLNTDELTNYLEVTGQGLNTTNTSLEYAGYHIDFDSVARFGMRHRTVNMMYGNTQKQLRQIAVGEMSRLNGKAFTATLSISLRPEIRLGYPVYVEHIDTYYYVTGINHSFSFGSNAQTDLVLESRRERLYTEDGTKILKSHVYRLKENKIEGFSNTEVLTRQENFLKAKNVVGGFDTGFYEVSPANTKNTTSDATNVTATDSTELLTFTDKTVPFSDLNGYRHIGGFPYGANLKLDDSGELLTSSDLKDLTDLASKLLKDPHQKVQDLEKNVIFNATKYIMVGDDLIPLKVFLLKDAGLPKQKNPVSDPKELRDPKTNSDLFSRLLKPKQKGEDLATYANAGVPKPPSTTQLTTPTIDQRDKIANGSVNIEQVS